MNHIKVAPILLIVYNRPDKVQVLVNALNLMSGLKIYVSADGPKDNHDDINRCITVRNLIDKLEANHTIIKNYSNKNLGCGIGCSDAISWFFHNEASGIIIEDDITFNEKFLHFASYALDKYKNNDLVYCISGSPYKPIKLESNNLSLSLYPNIWGWATWRESWKGYSLSLNNYSNIYIYSILIKKFTILTSLYWILVLMLVRNGKLDTWDHQFYFNMWKNNSYSIIPTVPFTNNIGFDADATCMKEPPNDFVGYHSDEDSSAYQFCNQYFDMIPSYNFTYDNEVELSTFKISIYSILKLVIKNMIWKSRPRS